MTCNMEKEYNESEPVASVSTNRIATESEMIIPVMAEHLQIDKKTIDTAKVIISKKVTEHQEEINIPLLSEQYEVVRVPVHQTVATPPAAMRQEGDTMIVTVVKEILVVEKRYEILEELHITRRVTEQVETQSITLQTEEISVTRTPLQTVGDIQ